MSLATATAALPARPLAVASPRRVLHAWHLLSLDAPTVAFTWTLLFARAGHLPHAWPAALALAGAVWVIYAADRLMDAARTPDTLSASRPLESLYLSRWRTFFIACGVVMAVTAAGLRELPLPLRTGWVLLALPLLGYAVAVHCFRMPGACKPWCVGLFFAAAVGLPVLLQPGAGQTWDQEWLAAALAFGALCVGNCRLLRSAPSQSWAIDALVCASLALWPGASAVTRPVALACGGAVALLWALQRGRGRLTPLTFRALADVALLAPALAVLLL